MDVNNNTETIKSRMVNEENEENDETLQNSSVAEEGGDMVVCIQIEGDHTTSTDTEVQIQETDRAHDTGEPNVEMLASCSSATIIENMEGNEQNSATTLTMPTVASAGNPLPSNACSADNLALKIYKTLSMEKMNEYDKQKRIQMKNIESENNEIAERFKKIIEMFDSFTKSLEALEPQKMDNVISSNALADNQSSETRRRPRKGKCVHPKVHLSRYADYHLQLSKKILPEAISDEHILTETNNQHTVINIEDSTKVILRDVATDTRSLENILINSLACQTSWHDNLNSSRTASLDVSLIDSLSSLSPSNDTPADKEILSNDTNTSLQQLFKDNNRNSTNADYEKLGSSTSNGYTPLEEAPKISNEQQTLHTYHIASVEASSSASSTLAQRATLCSRIWLNITQFCTAIFVCLQVNRDCIFCFGFLVVFVVSASFLTAFFYRTLSLSSSLLQITVPTYTQ